MNLKPDVSRIIKAAHLLESLIMDLGDEFQKVSHWIFQSGNTGLLIIWHILHIIVSICYFIRGIVLAIESYLISNGLFKRYKALNIGRVRYLAIVVDSKEARHTSKVIQLLQWLAAMGVRKVCLYDSEGVLMKSKEAIMEKFNPAKLSAKVSDEALITDPLLDEKHIEFVTISDGKEAIAKAANLLFTKYYLDSKQEKPVLTESDLSEALKTLGSLGPDPDLMLVYGPARCHLGFPAWRIRYTEIVHMGSLSSMKYGSLIKAIHKFTMVKQNYGK